MTKFFSSDLNNITPYTPGEQPKEFMYVKLNTNESPFPPTDNINFEVKNQADFLNLYPDPSCGKLKKRAAQAFGVEPQNILCGNGSDEVLYFVFRAFCSRNKGMACPDVSYGFYPVLCNLLGIPYTAVPLQEDFTINIADYAAITDNVCIANPNAQTGIYLPPESIEQLAKQNEDRLVVVDEAYIDFGGMSAARLVKQYKNLIVVYTMSKSHNLAGARVGFAIADEGLIADLEAVRNSFNPYNINRMSLAAAVESLNDVEYFIKCVSEIVTSRDYTTEKLTEMGLTVLPSKANFILVKSDIVGGQKLYKKLKEKSILVRHFDDKRIKDYVRITIGARWQMEKLVKAIEEILQENKK